jgi:hypothetical protein
MVPEQAIFHLDSEALVSRHRRQMMEWEMAMIGRALERYDGHVVWLKGASYIAQRLAMSEGRLPADIDLMVTRSRLEEVEGLLQQNGWKTDVLRPYDDRYYREWGHELPPMRCRGLPLELDVHHTILPVTGRSKPDAQSLLDASIALRDSRFRVFCPEDQVLHAVAQLFQDSDLNGRLRDLVDIDGLLRHHAQSGFWERLAKRALLHQLERPLWYALRYCNAWLQTPVPAEFLSERGDGAPNRWLQPVMDRLVRTVLLPPDPEVPATVSVFLAQKTMVARSYWLRMPPTLLAYHVSHKMGGPIWRKRGEALR